MDLDEVADELYAVPPDEFVAVRKQRQDDARAAGNRTLAREIGALPKPTTAAWVANLLARQQRAVDGGTWRVHVPAHPSGGHGRHRAVPR